MTSRTLLNTFFENLKSNPDNIAFSDTIGVIEEIYDFTPTKFTNGEMVNDAGLNSGSCKLFAFAKMHNFTINETLSCFGTYYRNDVLENPDGDDHQNIRNFIKFGWEGISFEGSPLVIK